jgi:hypothetical protein
VQFTRLWVLFLSVRKKRVQVIVNDGGAAHSGNHWAWVVSDGLLGEKKVIAEGYIDSYAYSLGNICSIKWLGEKEIEVEFVDGRRSNRRILVRAIVP